MDGAEVLIFYLAPPVVIISSRVLPQFGWCPAIRLCSRTSTAIYIYIHHASVGCLYRVKKFPT